jgi:flavin-dependent dehydrogenase
MAEMTQQEAPSDSLCDVLIIGGGPAGTTIASLLKEKGWRVTLLEQDRHPRFHIGESLLPMNLPLLARLGVLESVRQIGVLKYAAEFSPGDRNVPCQPFYFSNAFDKSHPYAYQVRRSEFDELLFRNCQAKGVEAREGVRVRDVTLRPGHSHLVHSVDAATGAAQTWKTRFVVDASGRDTLLSRKLGLKRKNPKHQSAAIFGHFENVVLRPGRDAGNISIYWFQHGWFWMIPLRDGIMSVGAVCWPEYLKTRRTTPEEFLWQTIRLCPQVDARMRDARLVDKARATGNYSYTSSRMYGDGYILVGDAFAFIDPVFSTGVMLAMTSATLAADAVDASLRDPQLAAPLLRRFDRRMRAGIATVSWFIYRFTSPAMQQMFMAPKNFLRVQEAVISVLAGDLFRNTPTALPLAVFKAIFYLTFVANFSRAWSSYRRRRDNVQVLFEGGTLPEDQIAR